MGPEFNVVYEQSQYKGNINWVVVTLRANMVWVTHARNIRMKFLQSFLSRSNSV